jgi:DNA invertase Pin-like site-specific DNA recombinase
VIISYVDTSKNNIKEEEQQTLLAAYVSEKQIKIDVTLQGEDVADVLSSIQSKTHTLLVANVLTLGDSLQKITENLIKLKEREMTVTSVRGDLTLTPAEMSDDFIKGMFVAAEISSLLISTATKRVLHEKRANGQKLGRAFGAHNKNNISTKYGEFMRNAHANGMSMAEISRQLHISYRSVFTYLKQQETTNA